MKRSRIWTRMRETRTDTGRRRAAGCRIALLAVLLAAPALAALLAGPGKAKKPQAPHALVAGTVFRGNGMSLPGAEVELTWAGSPQGTRKSKKMKAVGDARGEFAFRVPTDDLEYRVTARAPGFRPQEKTVRVSGEVRVDVFFSLEAAEEKEGK